MDCLYIKFEKLIEDTSDIRSSRMSVQIVDEEKIDFVNGKIRLERNSGLKIIEELDTMNPEIDTRPNKKPRVSIIGRGFSGIPEEESEWDDKVSRLSKSSKGGNKRSIQDILNEYIKGSDLQTVKRRDLHQVLEENNTYNRAKPMRIDSLSSRRFCKKLSDRLSQTHFLSEVMGDAVTDSQYVNDGMMTIESNDISNPYSLGKRRTNQKEGSINLYMKKQSNGSIFTDNNFRQTDREGSILSIRDPSRDTSVGPSGIPSRESSSNIMANAGRRRNSHIVRLDLVNNRRPRLASKQSIHSIRKAPSLMSIQEHPNEDINIDGETPNTLNVKNIHAQKRKSFYPTDKNQLNSLMNFNALFKKK